MFLPFLPNGKLLEIGCGSGELLENVRAAGWEAQGIDVDPRAVEHARMKGLPVTLASGETAQFPDNYFDAVVMSHVIEHVHDPTGLLRECWRILKPNGRISYITPNGRSLLRNMLGSSWFALEPPRHLHIFTPQAIRHLMVESGFELSSCVHDCTGRRWPVRCQSLYSENGKNTYALAPVIFREERGQAVPGVRMVGYDV